MLKWGASTLWTIGYGHLVRITYGPYGMGRFGDDNRENAPRLRCVLFVLARFFVLVLFWNSTILWKPQKAKINENQISADNYLRTSKRSLPKYSFKVHTSRARWANHNSFHIVRSRDACWISLWIDLLTIWTVIWGNASNFWASCINVL